LGFGSVSGIDISEVVVERGKEACLVTDAQWIVANGENLRGVDDQSVDLCFSYIVFQHMPTKNLIGSYMEEVSRFITPGGTIHLHFQGRFPTRLRCKK